ncbi:MAG: hypothetical protein WD342_03770 [Verrucomicrobiales bacterium]
MSPRPIFTLVAAMCISATSPDLRGQEKQGAPRPKAKKHETAQPARTPQGTKQVTRLYTIPPTFLVPREDKDKTTADPFAKKSTAAGSGAEHNLRMTFLKAGVELNTDDSVSYDAATEILKATTSVSAHRQLEEYFALLKNEAERQILILVEFIEVDHLDFSDWMLENRITGDGTPLRKEVQKWARDDRANILNSVMVTARSGQRAKTESIHEQIYPTEYHPPKIPNDLTQARNAEIPTTAITATAFETRNVGVTLEVDPVLGADNTTIDLNLAPEMVRLDGWSTWPNDEVDSKWKANLPTFYTMKTTTQVTTRDGRYAFVSTLRPLASSNPERTDAIVLLFVRADVGSMGEWSVEETK